MSYLKKVSPALIDRPRILSYGVITGVVAEAAWAKYRAFMTLMAR